jgi:hypothetical protein
MPHVRVWITICEYCIFLPIRRYFLGCRHHLRLINWLRLLHVQDPYKQPVVQSFGRKTLLADKPEVARSWKWPPVALFCAILKTSEVLAVKNLAVRVNEWWLSFSCWFLLCVAHFFGMAVCLWDLRICRLWLCLWQSQCQIVERSLLSTRLMD